MRSLDLDIIRTLSFYIWIWKMLVLSGHWWWLVCQTVLWTTMGHIFCWIRLFWFAFMSFHDNKKGTSNFIFTTFLHAGVMTVLILLAFRFFNTFQTTAEGRTRFQPGEVGTERAPLLSHKDEDVSSWGSSYDSVSHDEEDLEEQLAVNCIEGQQITEGENSNNPQRLCVICFDSSRDCFFLPCGHCAACFTCGTR